MISLLFYNFCPVLSCVTYKYHGKLSKELIHKAMPNPSPKLENLKYFNRADEGNEALSSQAMAVKVPIDVDKAIRALPNKAAWLRRVISKAAQEELMQPTTDKTNTKQLLEPLALEQRDRAIALLKSWREVDEEEAKEQRETGEQLFKALDEERTRIGARKLFL